MEECIDCRRATRLPNRKPQKIIQNLIQDRTIGSSQSDISQLRVLPLKITKVDGTIFFKQPYTILYKLLQIRKNSS